jgi:hypothetical protein
MDCPGVCAQGGELLRFRVVGVGGVEDGFSGPYSDMSIYPAVRFRNGSWHRFWGLRTSGGSRKPQSVRRDMAAVYFVLS